MIFRTMLHRIAGILGCLLLVTGMLLHLTVRDGHKWIATLFYAMPLPLILVGWLIAAAWHFRQRTFLIASLCMAFLTACWWQATSYRKETQVRSASPKPSGLKVLYWNMAHQKLPSTDLEQLIATHQPDIVGLGEVGLRSGDSNPLVRHLPPGYIALKPEHGMGLVVRGNAQVQQITRIKKTRSKFLQMDVTVDAKVWHIILVDGDADPFLRREELLGKVLAKTQASHTLVMGDFNTPLESQWFDPWRTAGLHHATEGARTGFRETWPRHWPVLTIDHLWCTPETQPVLFERVSLPSSDHLAIVASLR
ncbi:endonuclease/exonuclease/phosphatase family protein [Roseimicrobium gellanilyticum]|nr:endonuclease/exonuclease/phosphatase family protein [Roseimicrobium gellanilyticum]